MSEIKLSNLNRRDALKLGGLMTAAVAAAPAGEVLAAPKPPPALHSPTVLNSRAVGPPPLPPLSVIVLNRLAFGARPGELDAFQALGATDDARLQAWVDQQLNPNAINDSACDAQIAAAGLTTLNKSLTQLWWDHVLHNGGSWSVRMQPADETQKMTFLRAVYSKRQLKEVLADFWHNHFSVYAWDGNIAPVWVQYDRDVIRANIFGRFRTMLEAVATSPAMIYYLDNYINSRAGPNENYARELFELHALGAENYLGVMRQNQVPGYPAAPIGYVDDDVYEATRCFTGWRVADGDWPVTQDTGEFLYYDAWHDRFQKHVLGKELPADQPALKDGRDVLDALANHPGTARFITRKLCRRLIGDDPPQSIVDAAADVFFTQRNAADQLKQVVRTIVLSNEFKTTWGEKMKRPYEFAVSMLRAANAGFAFTNEFDWTFEGLGQPLFAHRPPDGYADYKDAWAGTSSLLQSWRLCNYAIENWIDGTTIDFVSQMPASLKTPNAIVDFWINRILGRSMHPAENRTALVDFIAEGRNPDFDLRPDQIADRLPRMVAVLLMSPDFRWR